MNSEITREIYWNIVIPFRGVTMAILALLPAVYVAWRFHRRWREWRSVGVPEPFPPRSEWPMRAKRVLRHTLLQSRVVRRRAGGWAHVVFYVSFILLFIGTVIVAIQADIATPLFDWYFFKDNFYIIFSATLEVAGVAGIAALGVALYRRHVEKPKYLGGKNNWLAVLWWLQAVMVTGFVVEAARISGTNFPPHEKSASFVGWALAGLVPQDIARPLHLALWWGHLFIALAFLAAFGDSAMKHVFNAVINIFLAREIPSGATPRPIEDIDNATTFGVLTVKEFRTGHLRDADVCLECGRCVEVCPANITGKPLSPKKIVTDIRELWRANLLNGGTEPPDDAKITLVGDGAPISADEVWSCTTCGACEQECPMMIEVVEKVVEMRRGLVLMKSEFPPEVQLAFTNLEQQGNPWGKPPEEREKWVAEIEEFQVPIVGTPEAEGAEYLYWVGCAGSLDARAQEITKALARLLHRAGIKFAILGQMETCTGDPALRIGNEYLYQILAKQNIETIQGANIPKIIASCPHCFQTIAKDYRNLGAEFEVVHHSDLLATLLADGRLTPKQKVEANAILHDSCYLARHNNIVDQPRAVANAALGIAAIAEPPRCGKKGLCCGAGGGRMWMEEHLGDKTINTERAEELLKDGAETIVTSCPFCKTMVNDGAKKAAPGKAVAVLDIAELLERGTREQ